MAMHPDATRAGADAGRISRRAMLLDAAGVIAILAIPVGAAIATAQPIPNPPDRKTLAALSPILLARLEQRHAAARARRRAAKKRSRKRSVKQDRAARQGQREQRVRSREERQRSRLAP